jgi:hypothetical protein
MKMVICEIVVRFTNGSSTWKYVSHVIWSVFYVFILFFIDTFVSLAIPSLQLRLTTSYMEWLNKTKLSRNWKCCQSTSYIKYITTVYFSYYKKQEQKVNFRNLNLLLLKRSPHFDCHGSPALIWSPD